MDRPRAKDRESEPKTDPETGTQAQAAGPELQLELGFVVGFRGTRLSRIRLLAS